MGFVVVLELKPSETQLSLMGLEVLEVLGEVSRLATIDFNWSTCQLVKSLFFQESRAGLGQNGVTHLNEAPTS